MPLPYKGEHISLARRLRREATPQERRLWYTFLSCYKVRFQRQKAIGPYIVDFYCHKAKLAIEIDGTQHYYEQEQRRDGCRSAKLQEYGVTVLRFSNKEINECFAQVCECIDRSVKVTRVIRTCLKAAYFGAFHSISSRKAPALLR
ncbi:MAG: endonuclease domain-containing protein [Oscillospiraceae bacterium]|nr:endonuclease domain-containing protein [Oscillospiraceae bacterium]